MVEQRLAAHGLSGAGDLYRQGIERLHQAFPGRVQEAVLMARHTTARLGGPADVLIEVQSAQELEAVVSHCWRYNTPFLLLGGGSNVLVSDRGVRGLVIINQARQVRFAQDAQPPTVWAESGANLGLIARQAALHGLAGLEWAAGIPGALGGAVVGNAGAHGGDIAGNLIVAEILQHSSLPSEKSSAEPVRAEWLPERLAFSYRSSIIKQDPGTAIVLAALLRLEASTQPAVQAKIDEFVAYRRRTQPPGASMGSMFKNPPGDYAGRLIEAAGLKGARQGEAQISPLHANFFINLGGASAADVYRLVQQAQQAVLEKFNVKLELEVQLAGEW